MTPSGDSPIRVATRRSPLALWQAERIASLLTDLDPSLKVEIVSMDTTADKTLDRPISDLGGKGAFSKEVQQLVLSGRADLAVHSAKDLQAITPDGLSLAAFPERGDPRDVLVGSMLADLKQGATVATGSQRRRVQLAELRPDLNFVELRGNIATRLGALDRVDAIVSAKVALTRLGIEGLVVEALEPEVMLPQVGQGALAVECRADDTETRARLSAIDHPSTRILVEAERDFLIELGGDCDLPAGAHARMVDDQVTVVGMLSSIDADGRCGPVHRSSVSGRVDDRPGQTVARRLQARL